jgi:Ca2+:H+ antiporter
MLNCVAIVPLADFQSQATEALAMYLGDTAGAFLNVTMGNATEVVILYVIFH